MDFLNSLSATHKKKESKKNASLWYVHTSRLGRHAVFLEYLVSFKVAGGWFHMEGVLLSDFLDMMIWIMDGRNAWRNFNGFTSQTLCVFLQYFFTFAASVSMPSAHYDKLNKYLTLSLRKWIQLVKILLVWVGTHYKSWTCSFSVSHCWSGVSCGWL